MTSFSEPWDGVASTAYFPTDNQHFDLGNESYTECSPALERTYQCTELLGPATTQSCLTVLLERVRNPEQSHSLQTAADTQTAWRFLIRRSLVHRLARVRHLWPVAAHADSPCRLVPCFGVEESLLSCDAPRFVVSGTPATSESHSSVDESESVVYSWTARDSRVAKALRQYVANADANT